MPRFWQILTKCMYVLVINHFYELVVYLLNSFLSSDCESTVFICHKQASCPVCEIISRQLIQSTADITIISYIFQWLSVQVHKTRFPTSTNLYFQRMQNWKDSWMDLVEKLNIFLETTNWFGRDTKMVYGHVKRLLWKTCMQYILILDLNCVPE